MELLDITRHLDTLLDVRSFPAESNGLLVSGAKQVKMVAGTVNLSWSSLRRAVDEGVSLLFSHHAAWKSTDAEIAEEKYQFAREAGLSVYVAHESLDRHPEIGTAISLARALECRTVSFFADGLGVIVLAPDGSSFASSRHASWRRSTATRSHGRRIPPQIGSQSLQAGEHDPNG